ncbi:hypothetical protein B0H11DRAFT_1991815 [Mycena galericulata]|nr:hypothetical protein B0H11DRAFT_1991815 [Mycena galericulata]
MTLNCILSSLFELIPAIAEVECPQQHFGRVELVMASPEYGFLTFMNCWQTVRHWRAEHAACGVSLDLSYRRDPGESCLSADERQLKRISSSAFQWR